MKLNKLSAFFLAVLLIGGVSESSFSVYAANDVEAANIEASRPDYTILTYQSFEDFEKELKDGTVYEKLSGDGRDISIGSSIYELSSAVKVNGRKLKLQETNCTHRDVTYKYDNEVYLTYYPNYTADEALNESYKNTKKTAIQTKTISNHKIYMKSGTQGYYDFYSYSWTQDDCLFELTIPQTMSLTYGFSLCKVNDRLKANDRLMLPSADNNSSVRRTKTGLLKNQREELERLENVDGLEKAVLCLLYPEYTPIDLAGKAENIIVGTVKSIEPGYSSEGNVYSKVDITVTEDLKGSTENKTVSIPMFGGMQDGIKYSYDGAPTYVVGEELLLYLNNMHNDMDKRNVSDESVWYVPLTYQSAVSLSKNNLSKSASDIIEQVKKDIIAAENAVSVSEEATTTIGEPVVDIMLEAV